MTGTVNLFARGLGRSDLRLLLLASVAVVGLGDTAALAQTSDAVSVPVGANTEREGPADAPSIPFIISVDGQTVGASEDIALTPAAPVSAAPVVRPVDVQRRTDVDLSAVDIQIKFDGLDVDPMLNVSTTPVRQTYRPGEQVRFLASTNYPGFIARSEVRIYEENDSRFVEEPIAVIPVQPNGETGWTMPERDLGTAFQSDVNYRYVLRVYDSQGRYDETEPLTIARSSRDFKPKDRQEAVAPGMAEDRTAIRNIPVNGGAVTVFGRNVPPGYRVTALGDTIPIDPNNAFVVQRILPSGGHNVAVAVDGVSKSGGLEFNRDINIPDNNWFYVGLADVTVGHRTGDGGIEAVRPGEYDEVYSKGRLAFYLKGKIKGEYLLTAAADTGEDELDRLFRNLDRRDARRLLRRLDPDDYYPVYGDDSTFVEDAPTNGKFYVRLERGDSHVMWGNYKTSITGTEFLKAERGLYGANAEYRSEEATSFGERRTEVTLYAAQPDTLPAREEFLATGGSVYFLGKQDIVEGSETLTVEIRDEVTGRTIERRHLSYGEDYSFDYLQGVVILNRPLSSTTGTTGPVRDGALGGNAVFLVTQYEYEPLSRDVDGYAIGGRGQHWINDHVRVGVTGMSETTGFADQQAGGADIRIRKSETTFLEAEAAHSKGPGFGYSRSTDGGLTADPIDTVGDPDRSATAWRVRGQVDTKDLGVDGLDGRLGGYIEEKEGGFSTLYDQINYDRRIWGAHADFDIGERSELLLTYDDFTDEAGQIRRDGSSSVSYQFDEYWKASFGISYRELMSPIAVAAGRGGYDGSRVDTGLRLDFRRNEDELYYVFGQATLDRSGDIRSNDRLGVGTEYRLTNKITASGEVSYGTGGVGALAALNYDPNADNRYYIGYRLDPDRSFDLNRSYDLVGRDKGTIVGGLRRRINDTASAYAESSYDLFGERNSLAQTYGIIYTPDTRWTLDAGLKVGRVRNDTYDIETGVPHTDFDRYAPSLSLAYKDEENGIAAHIRGEARLEDSEDTTRDYNTYLFAAGLSWKTNPSWRFIGNVDLVISDATSDLTSFRETEYVEASVGYAYRPVEHDRLNALFKYSWLYEIPTFREYGSGTVGDFFSPAQRSHIISADVNYDLFPWLTLGAKYGARFGEVKYRNATDDAYAFEDAWESSTAHLNILRAELHIVHKWDLLLEGRVLTQPEADTTDFGALAAVYRHVGENFKVGVGYNFGHFSDDLRDHTFDDRGVFFNVVGKF